MRKLLLPVTMLAFMASLTGTAQALGGEPEMQPGKYLLCTIQEVAEHRGLCPYQQNLPLAGLRGSPGVGAQIGWETYNQFAPGVPDATFGVYWAGWGTGNPLEGTYKAAWHQGILATNRWSATNLPAGTQVTVWVFPVITEAEWIWGPRPGGPPVIECDHPMGYNGPCGHYVGVRDPEGAEVTFTTAGTKTAALALTTTKHKVQTGRVLSVEPLVVRR